MHLPSSLLSTMSFLFHTQVGDSLHPYHFQILPVCLLERHPLILLCFPSSAVALYEPCTYMSVSILLSSLCLMIL